jgi:hypothetical protein
MAARAGGLIPVITLDDALQMLVLLTVADAVRRRARRWPRRAGGYGAARASAGRS